MKCSSPFVLSAFLFRYRKLLLLSVFFSLLLGTRATHLFGGIDGPHDWRQCDTAQYALSLYEDGISLMTPSVCWMGMHKTIILEFPFPELLMALGYKVLGYHLCIARLMTLAFFAGASLYLFLILRLMSNSRLAIIATAVYIVLPLSQFYSRAIHVDFFAVFFSHAMTFHLLRIFDRPRSVDLVFAIIMGALAFLVKAPYAFYFALPLICVALLKKSLRSLVLLGSCFFISALFFFLWRRYVDAVNAGAPNWFFIPGYYKHVDVGWWYYGPLHMRLQPHVWFKILTRFINEVTSPVGAWLFIAGFIGSIVATIKGYWRQMLPLWAWLAGLILYVTIFLNLNYIHDYYQIPFLGLSAVFIALAINAPLQLLGGRFRLAAVMMSLAMFGSVFYASSQYASRNYFKHDIVRETAGKIIEQVTPADAVLIAVMDSDSYWTDPRLLFRSKRIGWSINKKDLSGVLVEQLRNQGATHVAIVEKVSGGNNLQILGMPVAVFPLNNEGWKVMIATLLDASSPPTRKAIMARQLVEPQH